MHTLDLETLSEERLKKAVDAETHRLGMELFTAGRVEVLELADLSALCNVLDKRNQQVRIKIANNHLLFKCECRHATRGLICEHDVAAWMGIRQRLERDIPPVWRAQLDQVINAAPPARRPRPRQALLYFSLQPDSGSLPERWKIAPYFLSPAALPQDLQPELDDLAPQALADKLAALPAAETFLRPLSQPLDPAECLNCAPAVVSLANLLAAAAPPATAAETLAIRSLRSTPALEDILALLRQTDAPLWRGASSAHPLQERLELVCEPGEILLHIDRQPDGLHLFPRLILPGTPDTDSANGPVSLLPILERPAWLLAGNRLVELKDPAGLNLLASFRLTEALNSELRAILVPDDQQADFLDQYLLDLARSFPLAGNGVDWREVEAQPVPRLYLSDANKELQVQLRFAYGEAQLDYQSDLPEISVQHLAGEATLLRIHRQPAAEQAALEVLNQPTFGLKRAPLPSSPGLFRLRARTHPVDFLLNTLPRLAHAGFEIYGEEQLKSARVNRHTPTISFRVASGIDWFDVQTVVSFGELQVSFQEVRRALRKRERYIKLADGSIGELPEEWLERYRHLFSLAESTPDGLRVSRHHLTLIDEALESAPDSQADAEFQRRRAALRQFAASGFQGIQPRLLPQVFTGELRPYQKSGFDWLHFLHDFEFGGCLADDMGLGKTIQTLAFLQSLYGGQAPADRPGRASLLVVPRSLLVNWQREATRFTPGLRMLEFFDTDRVKDTNCFNDVDLVITTYGVMLRDIQLLHGYTFYYAILDESQSIKNPLSQTARAAHLLQASHRLVLTGTPIENSTSELWSQFAFLNPGLLGSLKYFKTEFGMPIEKKRDENAAASLRRLVYPFIMRRTKDLVAPELPPRSERLLYSDMDPAQLKLYNKTRDYYRGVLLGMLESEGLNASRMKILEGLLRLRQIANHPRLVDDKFHGGSGKFELLLDTLETLRAENHKALVFSQFVQMLSLVRSEMDARQMRYNYLDGQTVARQEQVDIFQSSPDIPFFLISLKAGGLGLNLTAADYVLHIDPWWNPAVEMQASDRTHRIGQDKPVFVYKLIARDSVEEKILQLQDRKRSLVDQIITTEASFFKNLTADDVSALFS